MPWSKIKGRWWLSISVWRGVFLYNSWVGNFQVCYDKAIQEYDWSIEKYIEPGGLYKFKSWAHGNVDEITALKHMQLNASSFICKTE